MSLEKKGYSKLGGNQRKGAEKHKRDLRNIPDLRHPERGPLGMEG